MRLIAGKYKGRALQRPDERVTRPTTDRNREALFNILSHSPHVALKGAVVLDVFAGSGALGLEALSRGAEKIFFVEKHPEAVRILRENIASLACQEQVTVFPVDLQRLLAALTPVDLVLMDPPYEQNLELVALNTLFDKGWVAKSTFIVVETKAKAQIPLPSWCKLVDQRVYGNSAFHFLLCQ